MIELEEVSKSYRGPQGELLLALDRVSFVARPGRVTALLGRNGAGKTTALRIVSTILAPTGGRARVLGHDTVTCSAEVRGQVGFLSPSIGTFDRLTPAEVIEFFGEMHGLSPALRARRRVELAERLGLGALLERACGTLSTGEKQRVQLARALVHEPRVIVLDEPTVGLDVVVARSLRETIQGLRGQERTILLSTHAFSEVEHLADDVVILDEGRVLVSGTLPELVGAHASLEAAFFALVGAPGGAA